MPMADAVTIADKWSQAMQNASGAYTAGINRVTESPMAKAAQNVEAYRQGIMDAINSGKWQAGLNRVSLSQWKENATKVGAGRLGTGAAQAKPKMLAFMQQFLPFLANAQAQVKSMPNATYEQRKARATAMMDLVHEFKRS